MVKEKFKVIFGKEGCGMGGWATRYLLGYREVKDEDFRHDNK